jgi:hypothetical protein
MCSNLPPKALSSLFPTLIDEILWDSWTDGTLYQNEQICILVWSINVCTLWLYSSQGWMLSQNILWATFCPASLLQMFASKFLGIIVCYRQWVFCKISSLGIIWKFHLALCSSFRSATSYQFPIISYFLLFFLDCIEQQTWCSICLQCLFAFLNLFTHFFVTFIHHMWIYI